MSVPERIATFRLSDPFTGIKACSMRPRLGDGHATRFMGGQFPHRAVPARMCPATMSRTDLQIVKGGAGACARRRSVPRQYRTAASRRTEIPEGGHRTSIRLTRSSPAQLGGRMHPGPVSYHGAEQGSTPVGGSTALLRQRSREAAWWDGPGPALSRGPSLDGLKTDSTGDRGRAARRGANPPSPTCPLINATRRSHRARDGNRELQPLRRASQGTAAHALSLDARVSRMHAGSVLCILPTGRRTASWTYSHVLDGTSILGTVS